MNTPYSFTPIAPRTAPTNNEGIVPWLRNNLFSDWKTSIATLIILAILLRYIPSFIDWAVIRAVVTPDSEMCRQAGVGACWGAVVEKYRLMIFGRYPSDAHWRPFAATVLLLGLLMLSCIRFFWKK